MTPRRIILSGCSGGGKSTLLAALSGRGFCTFSEPGRRVVTRAQAGEGGALPWQDLAGFCAACLSLAQADHDAATGLAFYDRSAVDALAALERAGLQTPHQTDIAARQFTYTQVFLTPPWPEIFAPDAQRQGDFSAACAEYEHLTQVYPRLGIPVTVLPKAPVAERLAFLLARL